MKVSGWKQRQRLKTIAKRIKAAVAEADSILPTEGRAVGGKYDGRLGKVTGSIAHGQDFLIGFYVYKTSKPGGGQINREILNSDVESRRYRSLDEVELIFQRELNV